MLLDQSTVQPARPELPWLHAKRRHVRAPEENGKPLIRVDDSSQLPRPKKEEEIHVKFSKKNQAAEQTTFTAALSRHFQIQDRDGAKQLLTAFFARSPRRRIKHIWADGGYTSGLIACAKKLWRCTVEIVKRSDLHTFEVLPRRWVVERTFAWWMDKGCPSCGRNGALFVLCSTNQRSYNKLRFGSL